MSAQQLETPQNQISNSAILIGTGLAIASFIVLPAVAARLGIGSSLTGAMRIALMKASTKVCNNSQSNNLPQDKDICSADADCQH
ncbi:MAG: hypothetical protein GQ582_03180 [Methyloprofundus sp.]|nr:hypothetical protein [Methyloprofundus sp.]